jgi:hypothetical protein
MANEPFDEYVDQFTMTAGPYGMIMNFKKSSAKPVPPGSVQQLEDVGSIRMSLEHFKVMTFIMKRHVHEIEGQLGAEIPIGGPVMHGLKIAPEDWQKFWQTGR